MPGLIAIDVGHSLQAPGATSAHGIGEFAFNRSLAEVINATLKKPTLLIAADGKMTGLEPRTQSAARAGADFLLSVHHDSAQIRFLKTWQWQGKTLYYSNDIRGFSLFVSRKQPYTQQSLACASAIGQAMRDAGYRPSEHHAVNVDGENRPWADRKNGVYFFDDLVVLKTAQSPAVLLEAGVIINPEEALQLQKRGTQRRIAQAVATGLKHCGY